MPDELTPDLFMAAHPAKLDDATASVYAAMRAKHADFGSLQPVMLRVAQVLPPAWGLISLPDYLSCLFAIAKHSDFAEPLRQQLLLQEAAPASAHKM